MLVNAQGEPTKSDQPAQSAPPRVAICVPCQDQVAAGWAFDLASLVGATAYNAPEIQLVSLQVKTTILPDQRNSLVRKAMEAKATHILWLDSDMRFPKDTLLRLLSHDVAIVGANYSTRRMPAIPTAEIEGQGLVYSNPDADGLVEVSRLGFGVILTKMEVFEKMPRPYFSFAYRPKFDDFTGEDVYFCRQARRAGFPSYVDLGLSHRVAHLGEMPFTEAHIDAMREVAQAEGRQAVDVGDPNGPLDPG